MDTSTSHGFTSATKVCTCSSLDSGTSGVKVPDPDRKQETCWWQSLWGVWAFKKEKYWKQYLSVVSFQIAKPLKFFCAVWTAGRQQQKMTKVRTCSSPEARNAYSSNPAYPYIMMAIALRAFHEEKCCKQRFSIVVFLQVVFKCPV
jgi:hypothetical protein